LCGPILADNLPDTQITLKKHYVRADTEPQENHSPTLNRFQAQPASRCLQFALLARRGVANPF